MVFPGGKLDLTTSGCGSDKNQKLGCVAGDDKIGTITKTYYGPGYGAGVSENPSSSGDFKLTYAVCNPNSKVDNPYC